MADKKTQERIKWLPLESNPDVINKVPFLLPPLLISKKLQINSSTNSMSKTLESTQTSTIFKMSTDLIQNC